MTAMRMESMAVTIPSESYETETGAYLEEQNFAMDRQASGDIPPVTEPANKQDREEAETTQDQAGRVSGSTDLSTSVGAIVDHINFIAFTSVEHGKLEIGAYILREIFQDNIEEVLSKNPAKRDSLRRVCEHGELRVDRRRLSNWVRAAALKKDLESIGQDCSALTVSHLVALLQVKDKNTRRKLAAEAVSVGLTVRTISQRARQSSQEGLEKMTAKALFKKLANPLSLISDQETMSLLTDEHRLAQDISCRDRLEIVTIIDNLAEKMDRSKNFLDEVRDNLIQVEMQRLNRSQA